MLKDNVHLKHLINYCTMNSESKTKQKKVAYSDLIRFRNMVSVYQIVGSLGNGRFCQVESSLS